MHDDEADIARLGLSEIARVLDLWRLHKLLQEGVVVAFRHNAHVVEARLDAPTLALNQLHTRSVVHKVGLDEFDALARIELALEHEVEVVEVQLQLLIGKIDAKLLEVIGLEDLEPKNVEHRHLPIAIELGICVCAYARVCRCVCLTPASSPSRS